MTRRALTEAAWALTLLACCAFAAHVLATALFGPA